MFLVRRAFPIAVLGLLFAMLKAQNNPLVQAGVPSVRLCKQKGVRSIRIDVPLTAMSATEEPVMIHRLPSIFGIVVRDVGTDQEYKIPLGYRPEHSGESLSRLESAGGSALALSRGQRIAISGPYLAFLVSQREADEVGATTPMLIQFGHKYEIRADLRFWREEQIKRWTSLGYVAARDAAVTARFEVPADPQWDACPNDPAFANKREQE
jgi:hypothetical protein